MGWLFAMRATTYLLNRLPTKILYGMSLFEVLSSKLLDYTYCLNIWLDLEHDPSIAQDMRCIVSKNPIFANV